MSTLELQPPPAPESNLRRGYLDYTWGQLHYRSMGCRSLPLLVLLHQTPSASEMYLPLMRLVAKRYHVVAIDTPGFGASDPMPGRVSVKGLGQELHKALLKKYACPYFLFGHHSGAAIATSMAAENPQWVTSLALSGPPLLTEAQRQALPHSAEEIPLEEDGGHLLKMWWRLRKKDHSAPLEISQRELQLAFTCGNYYRECYQAVADYDFASDLSRVTCPILLFAGKRDLLYGAVAASKKIARDAKTLHSEVDAATYVCETHAPFVASALREFFVAPDLQVERAPTNAVTEAVSVVNRVERESIS
ncbi:alpha/beta hydrolase [Microbulbifer bruguierae]|uniref:Alpha/beta hydrolase n=1 Tax=Microbulbifer bruguierae TaxID=3029061 RepID=A0ABY8ND28_9GAMM|nr:alpha/beta hydrolase [Microbulbifer bruguierae]WGL16830.1 alpha/beta hydrolase [Microbulbifer bruguierae]